MQNKLKLPNVICVHIGARAHYLVPNALVKMRGLNMLITDTWISNKWLRKLLGGIPLKALQSLAGRYESSIPTSLVKAYNVRFVLFELKLRIKYTYNWESTILRDQYFEQLAVRAVTKNNEATHVFGFSYTALECFKVAQKRGLKTILFQIDPGLFEEDLVAKLIEHSNATTLWNRAPHVYWKAWREECALADTILVNSNWSKECLIQEGIDAFKIKTIPLPFELEGKHQNFSRIMPMTFTKDRPLRCLFLGTLTLRKGIHIVLEAAAQLQHLPIEFILVGRNEVDEQLLQNSNIHYKGVVTRAETDLYYQEADVFLFPTFSDGFGLTQLEAMAWQLPVIATKHCGKVVEDTTNGWLMPEINAAELVRILTALVHQPVLLQNASKECLPTVEQFSLPQFADALEDIL